jgi:dihydrofolate synthase / folylpolyglutamate synthase
MNYSETVEYLYKSAPLFQQIGKDAYKAGLDNTNALDEHFGHPHKSFKTIHIGGTNGKGSCSHTLAAILQSSGLKVGLYTSPHLVSFRERIRVNGIPIPGQYVVNFVDSERHFFEPLHPSFFELATAMAFRFFADEQVDVAVVEVGMGGRLDCTNIISPDISIITNISLDHTQFLGSTLAEIAGEKAGIIKFQTPVVIGETTPETHDVFKDKAKSMQAPLYFAEDNACVNSVRVQDAGLVYQTSKISNLYGELGGLYQIKNTNTILTALRVLQEKGYTISEDHIRNGFAHVCELTGLMGRWQQLDINPLIVCDTGHNVGGFQYLVKQLNMQKCKTLRIVIGMVSDKDINGVLSLLPQNAVYYFTQASVKRALPATDFAEMAFHHGLHGNIYSSVSEAFKCAKKESDKDDFIFVGGSSFIVSDLLKAYF